jgi:hypothetical protein
MWNVRQASTREIHAGIQIRGGSPSQGWAVDSGDGKGAGHSQGQPEQLGALERQGSAKGVLSGAGDKPAVVSAEQMELARLRAEVARLRMERDIAKKAAAYFAQNTLRGTPGFSK